MSVQPEKSILLYPGSVRQADLLAQQTPNCHLLAGELTPLEQAGTLITGLVGALHALLSQQQTACFIVPRQLAELSVPDPDDYMQDVIRLAVGETLPMRQLIAQAIERGYVRHQQSLEPGSLRVRGEQLEIAHPALAGTYLIRWHGSTIEAIIHQTQRQMPVSQVRLLPMRFPEKTIPLRQLYSQFLLLEPPTVKQQTMPISYERALELIGELTPGKPVVHADHGIGIYEGLQSRQLGEQAREYLIIRYAAGDSLSVPVAYAHKLSPYIGASTPTIHRLGGTAWASTRRQAKEEAVEFARELLAIAQRRHGHQRTPYHIDQTLEEKLDRDFMYQMTADQQQTWQEVKEDLVKSEPMDRLVVGDVGFGKTEIAIRAASHIASNGRQIALLAPTTILVQQHFDTFKQRLPGLKEKIGLLSRFITPAEQEKTRANITSGKLQIVIGTHALLAKHTQWKNLGLVIIDEEQRFGVRQKEHFKNLRATVDVLSLSATPIPRTLSMALSGLRTLSLINTPPPGRKQVVTRVAKTNDELLRTAVNKELDRGGQVYIVAPKISQLGMIKERIASLVRPARIAVAHGQMNGSQLSQIMHQFDSGQLDVLVSSSIIENGLDLPNANTIIVWQATHFGLADLYQLRGRVGRRDREAYAYFLYNQDHMTSLQRQRLTALTEASRLGSGWAIARRDLEMRGAGNLLGADQSGTVNAVGVQLYLDMVRQEVDHAGLDLTAPETNIQLPLPALLPATYISSPEERTKWYVRLSRASSLSALADHVKNLEQTFGPLQSSAAGQALPPETQNLILLLELQLAAQAAGITKISHQKISPADEEPYDRLIIHSPKLPELLAKLSSLGNWVVRKDALTLDIDAITPELVKQLIRDLQKV